LAIAADGYPASTTTVAYEGHTISGVKALTMNDPAPRQIVHQGDDSVFALDVLPPTEPVTGEMRVGKVNDTVDAILGDENAVTVGEATFFGIGTDKRGDENQVVMLAYRQTLDTDPSSAYFGSRRWESRLFPKAILVSRDGSFDENPEERIYTVTPQFVTKYPWGVTFAAGTEGYTRAQVLRGMTEYKPKLVAFNGDGSATTMALPTTHPAASTAKIAVWVDGTLKALTTDYTVLTTAVTFVTAPTTDANVVVFYEHE